MDSQLFALCIQLPEMFDQHSRRDRLRRPRQLLHEMILHSGAEIRSKNFRQQRNHIRMDARNRHHRGYDSRALIVLELAAAQLTQ